MKLKLLLLTTILSLTACQPDDSQNAENDQAQKTEQLQDEANRQLGMPDIVNFQERRMAKQILELRDTTISTHTYLVNQMKGCLVYMGNSIGYGLPYAVQYTNPQRIAKFTETPEHGNVTLPQADPNGLYMPITSLIFEYRPSLRLIHWRGTELPLNYYTFRLNNQIEEMLESN